MLYFADNARHLICFPYTKENLHSMAVNLGIKRHWFHASPHAHYDIPKKMIEEVHSKVTMVTQSELLRIAVGMSPIGKMASTKVQVELFGHIAVPIGQRVKVLWADSKLGNARVQVELEHLSKTLIGEHEFDIFISNLQFDD